MICPYWPKAQWHGAPRPVLIEKAIGASSLSSSAAFVAADAAEACCKHWTKAKRRQLRSERPFIIRNAEERCKLMADQILRLAYVCSSTWSHFKPLSALWDWNPRRNPILKSYFCISCPISIDYHLPEQIFSSARLFTIQISHISASLLRAPPNRGNKCATIPLHGREILLTRLSFLLLFTPTPSHTKSVLH